MCGLITSENENRLERKYATKYQGMLHGSDYNPEQWKDYPEILKQDIQYMKESRCNVVSLGIFSWATLEPEERKYDFTFMDLPEGVTVHTRETEEVTYTFVENYYEQEKMVTLTGKYIDMETGEELEGEVLVKGYGIRVLKSKKVDWRRQ